jgi:hypothetical protein
MMKNVHAVILWLALGVSVSSANAVPRLDCPCGIDFKSQTSVELTAGIVNTSTQASGEFRLVVHASTDLAFASFFQLTAVQLDSIPALGTLPATTYGAPIEFNTPGGRQYYRLALQIPDGAGWRTVDSVRMSGALTTGYRFGEASPVDPDFPNIYMPSNPAFTLGADGRDFTLSIDEIVSDSPDQAFGSVTLELYESASPILYGTDYYLQFSRVLNGSIGPNGGLQNISISGRLDFDLDPQIYLHLALLDSSGNLAAWQTVYTNTEAGLTLRNATLSGVDYLTDADADGAPDYSERVVGFSPADAGDVPDTSLVKVLLLQPSDLPTYPGYDARLAHITSYSNQVMAESGVDMQFEFVGPVDIATTRSVESLNNSALLNLLTSRGSVFANIDSLRVQNNADLVIYLDRSKSQDTSCGVAWLSGVNMHGDVAPDLMDYEYNIGVVDIDEEFCSTRTLVHEIGHLLGLGHSRRQNSEGTFAWSVGHGVDDDFATIMAYETSFGEAVERDYFSSPDNTLCNGSPCGVSRLDPVDGADAALTLNAIRLQVERVAEGFGPAISLNGAASLVVAAGSAFNDPGATAIDYEDGDLSSRIQRSGIVNTTKIGDYTLTYAVSDSNGRQASIQRVVRVLAPSGDDSDADGVPDSNDRFPNISLGGLLDTDFDGVPDVCALACLVSGMIEDIDDDGDGIDDLQEGLDGTDPKDPTSFSLPTDGLTGKVYHWSKRTPMAGVGVTLSPSSAAQTTVADGAFQFAGLSAGGFSLTFDRGLQTSDVSKVITSADALAALKIAVGLNPNSDPDGAGPLQALPISPYQLIAADINRDGRVSSSDALGILKVAVGLSDAPTPSWLLVHDALPLWRSHNQRDRVYTDQSIALEYPAVNVVGAAAILVGDVNGSWSDTAAVNPLPANYFTSRARETGAPLALWQIADQDGDGLSDEEETALGTGVFNADSDGDGVVDGNDSAPLNAAVAGYIQPDSVAFSTDGTVEPLSDEPEFGAAEKRGIDAAGEPSTETDGAIEHLMTPESSALYLRGDMNDWNLDLPLVRDASGSGVVEIDLAPGMYAFKIADHNWSDVDLGPQASDATIVQIGLSTKLSASNQVLLVEVRRHATYRFTVSKGSLGYALEVETIR